MAANAADLCLSSTVAADLGVADDATVQRCVTAASRAIARWCGRTFEHSAAIVEYVPGFGRPYLILERPPIVSITSIVELGAEVDAANYESVGKNAEAGMVRRKNGGVWANTARLEGRITDTPGHNDGETGDAGITVTYEGGYVTPGQVAIAPAAGPVTVPEDLQEAAVIVASAFYRRLNRDPNIASESLGDWSVSYAGGNSAIGRGAGGIPDIAVELLASYRLLRVP